jgi:ketosteroid isomerase-like protein
MATDVNAGLMEEARAVLEAGDLDRMGQFMMAHAAPDMVNEFPQSGERFRGRDAIIEMNQSYPTSTGTSPTFALRELRTQGNLVVFEGTVDYGNGTTVENVSIIELRDGQVVRQTDYFAAPFEAPEWRRKYRSET